MGIYIPGMEMPTSCRECPFEREILMRYVCAISGKARNWGLETRLSDCPLVSIPPPGDLIGGDALPTSRVERGDIVNALTIIEVDEADMDSLIRIFEEDDKEDGMDSFIRILKD